MKIYLGADHAGFALKEKIKVYLDDLGHEVVDKGATTFDMNDDYPDFVRPVAEAVAAEKGTFGIIIGASGQGEAMAANRIPGARAMVYYGPALILQTDSTGNTINIIASGRKHNNANIISLGARFLSDSEAAEAITLFIQTDFCSEERHVRRISKFDPKS